MREHFPVVPHLLATQDLRATAAHYTTEADAASARRFIDAAEQAFTRISHQPGTGSPRHAVEFDWPGLRTLQVERFPYLAFYLEEADPPEQNALPPSTGSSKQRSGSRMTVTQP